MKTLTDQLAKYAEYHRDVRNIATHLVGVPMIVVAVAVLLSRPAFEVAGLPLSPLVLVVLATLAYYFALSVPYALAMTLIFAATLWFGAWSAAQSTGVWLGIGLGLFVVGWIIQFVGHYFEGRKPAFVDDALGLIIAPLFIAAEVMFMLGLQKPLREAVEAKAGPLRGGASVKAG